MTWINWLHELLFVYVGILVEYSKYENSIKMPTYTNTIKMLFRKC